MEPELAQRTGTPQGRGSNLGRHIGSDDNGNKNGKHDVDDCVRRLRWLCFFARGSVFEWRMSCLRVTRNESQSTTFSCGTAQKWCTLPVRPLPTNKFLGSQV